MTYLTPKQERFTRLIALENYSQTDAYREAYNPSGLAATVWQNASRLANSSKVSARIADLRDSMVAITLANHIDRQAFWTEIMRDKDINTRDRLKASELLGRDQGDFTKRRNAKVTRPKPDLRDFTLEDLRALLQEINL